MTNTTQAVEQVLKTDGLGRVRTPAARREQLLDEFERSGLSGQQFAQLLGLKYQTFATWAQKRRRQRGIAGASPVPTPMQKVQWLEAVVEQARGGAGSGSPVVTVHLPGGARLEIGDGKQAEMAALLLRALEKPC